MGDDKAGVGDICPSIMQRMQHMMRMQRMQRLQRMQHLQRLYRKAAGYD